MAPALEIDKITKRYGEVVAVEDMTFAVPAGQIFGFVGANGAGIYDDAHRAGRAGGRCRRSPVGWPSG